MNEDGRDQVIAFTELCVSGSLRHEDRSTACGACANHNLATADAIIYATALEHGADVLTCDAHFRDLPRVLYVAKAKS